ncbi:MAG: carboxypeptidase regulatory-like domain-containing protein [Actinomycetota bacterium]|nr:carboxypeptidase regulatory-like domain-containing protein [Actinomycetota bacterium]
MAAAQVDVEDIRILERIAAIYQTLDPVPDGLIDRIQFGITLDALHAEIAQLQRSVDLAGVRSEEASEAQTVTFASASLTTIVTITPTLADRARIDGWVVPAGAVEVELRLVEGSQHVVADDDGRFVFDDVVRGLGQFVLRRPNASGHPPVITPSIEL